MKSYAVRMSVVDILMRGMRVGSANHIHSQIAATLFTISPKGSIFPSHLLSLSGVSLTFRKTAPPDASLREGRAGGVRPVWSSVGGHGPRLCSGPA
jgi:hypothetical protein